jgi:hypothetical protein
MADTSAHQDAWLQLPWLANGRLSGAERMRVEEHVRGCALCAREVAQQQWLCDVLTEPERVTHAPGPSLRKLLNRIDGRAPPAPAEPRTARLHPVAARGGASAWRPPGLAWAASFLLVVGFAGLAATTYRWSQPRYVTHTAVTAGTSTAVLHISFLPSLSIAEVGAALRSAGARVVEGPDATGVFGVTPAARSPDAPNAADADSQLRTLAARLRADARVRWVEPLSGAAAAAAPQRAPPQP